MVPTAEAIEMARTGAMKDALSALAVLQCEPKLRELGLTLTPRYSFRCIIGKYSQMAY